jgi:type II secretory pathway pseudopilin PulG
VNNKRKAAFTMIEILLALGIFIIGIVSIVSVFPDAKGEVTKSENKTITARFADSLIHAIIRGGREFSGVDNAGIIQRKDVVNFTFDVNDTTYQDFFVLPMNPLSGVTDASDVIWFPQEVTWPAGIDYGTIFGPGTLANPNAGFEGNVRRLGRAALGSSQLDKDLTSTKDDFVERLSDFYFCFSITRAEDKKASEAALPGPQIYFQNLFRVSLFIYHGGINPNTGSGGGEQGAGPGEVFKLIDIADPVGAANNFIDRFDFLVNINKG